MKNIKCIFALLSICLAVVVNGKDVEDFNFDWSFHLGDIESAYLEDQDVSDWSSIRVPHDWSVGLPYVEEGASSSTGFKLGGIGWYRKTFELSKDDLDKVVWLEFDGIYNNSQIWVNGRFAAERPSGYSSFSVPVSNVMKEGRNVVAVRVDRTAYADSRWYTGSGIYRSVRLVKAEQTHIPQWGVQVRTPKIDSNSADVTIDTQVVFDRKANRAYTLEIELVDTNGERVGNAEQSLDQFGADSVQATISISNPELWSLESPTLYTAVTTVKSEGKVYDRVLTQFGIRSIEFSASNGFLLNGVNTKIKGVNLHHDAGAVGAAVPKEIWRYRLQKLQSIGVNAIRMSHNPHSPELLDLCDEMGLLAISEIFDDWERAKDKSIVFLSDNAAKGDAASSYTKHFNEWSERDAKDVVRRDVNHPSVIMWSIGNEIEWTYPKYQAAQTYQEELSVDGREVAVYDPEVVQANYDAQFNEKNPDHLAKTAKRLAGFVKEIDQSRPVTAGLVTPAVGFVSGYTDALDLVGFNYGEAEYDDAHATYPDKPMYGSENWGNWREWKAVLDRDYLPGIFVWTGFAYMGEAGPWPRKGLQISFFDYAGNKTPRGHQFESFWVDAPKVYLATMPLKDSEYQYDEEQGWTYTARTYPIPKMQWLRPWEWFGVAESWNYELGEEMLVHVYSNTEESELFLNGKSLGKQTITDDNDRILFWTLPYESGELKVVGYNEGNVVDSYTLNTHKELASLKISSSKIAMVADRNDVTYVHVRLLDENGTPVLTPDQRVSFSIEGPATLLAVDNGWEKNVQPEIAESVVSHDGRALAVIQSTAETGMIKVTASVDGIADASIEIVSVKNR